jgi:hypothetical protein
MRNPAKLPVHIYDDCDVDNEVVNVSKEAGDEVEWHSTGEAFTIEFESSPFERDTFDVPAGGCISSGPVAEGTPYARFHYLIRSRANLAMSADPDVNIKR